MRTPSSVLIMLSMRDFTKYETALPNIKPTARQTAPSLLIKSISPVNPRD